MDNASTDSRATKRESTPRIICFCGSSRFCREMAVIRWEYEKMGYITLGLHLLPEGYNEEYEELEASGMIEGHLAEFEGVAEAMDELHLRKIDISDEVLVVNIGGYIGESTAREIDYATAQGKPVTYFESPV